MIAKLPRPSLAPTFTVVDAETREDLVSRREVKYAIDRVDVGKLRRLLDGNCERLVHNHKVSLVRSIYFDDAQLSACRANLNGLSARRKFRLRWYDSLQPQRDFFFEIKWRDNRVTGKHRFQLRSETPLHEMTYAQIVRQLEHRTPEYLIRDLLLYNEPIVIVEYKREHFSTGDGLRITLDYDLTYYDQTAKRSVSTRFPRPLEGLVVLEGKTPVGRETELRRWLHPLQARATRCSKYVHGCRIVGLIRDSEL
ncbi:MAG: polyphosphate polymerase domain-containing protein [Rubripirellula sp.]